jgi:hypothetical protein
MLESVRHGSARIYTVYKNYIKLYRNYIKTAVGSGIELICPSMKDI